MDLTHTGLSFCEKAGIEQVKNIKMSLYVIICAKKKEQMLCRRIKGMPILHEVVEEGHLRNDI